MTCLFLALGKAKLIYYIDDAGRIITVPMLLGSRPRREVRRQQRRIMVFVNDK